MDGDTLDTRQEIAHGLRDALEDEELTEQEKLVMEFLLTTEITIGLDFDGTVYDSDGLKARLARLLFGINVPKPSRLRSRFIKQDGWLTAEQYDLIKTLVYETEVGLQADYFRSSVRYLTKLQRLGFGGLVVSNREPLASLIAELWLKQQQLEVEFCGVGIGQSKAEAAKDCTFFVENDAAKLVLLEGVVPHLLHVIADPNWEHGQSSGNAQRVYAWDQAYQEILDVTTAMRRPVG